MSGAQDGYLNYANGVINGQRQVTGGSPISGPAVTVNNLQFNEYAIGPGGTLFIPFNQKRQYLFIQNSSGNTGYGVTVTPAPILIGAFSQLSIPDFLAGNLGPIAHFVITAGGYYEPWKVPYNAITLVFTDPNSTGVPFNGYVVEGIGQ